MTLKKHEWHTSTTSFIEDGFKTPRWAYKNIDTWEMGGEIWLPIYGYEGMYEISSFTRVRSLERTVPYGKGYSMRIKRKIKIQKQMWGRGKYLTVSLFKDGIGTTFLVHRLVAIHFIPNPENKPEVNHKKGIVTDNRISEIEWATQSEQILHSYRVLGRKGALTGRKGSLCHFSKPVYCLTNKKKYSSATEAAKDTGCSFGNVSSVCRGDINQINGFKFKYL